VLPCLGAACGAELRWSYGVTWSTLFKDGVKGGCEARQGKHGHDL
jgi:hypothetical protein